MVDELMTGGSAVAGKAPAKARINKAWSVKQSFRAIKIDPLEEDIIKSSLHGVWEFDSLGSMNHAKTGRRIRIGTTVLMAAHIFF